MLNILLNIRKLSFSFTISLLSFSFMISLISAESVDYALLDTLLVEANCSNTKTCCKQNDEVGM